MCSGNKFYEVVNGNAIEVTKERFMETSNPAISIYGQESRNLPKGVNIHYRRNYDLRGSVDLSDGVVMNFQVNTWESGGAMLMRMLKVVGKSSYDLRIEELEGEVKYYKSHIKELEEKLSKYSEENSELKSKVPKLQFLVKSSRKNLFTKQVLSDDEGLCLVPGSYIPDDGDEYYSLTPVRDLLS